ncbi:hypothetical protein SteCoe_13350 [Stentor coeruleus]|uniref:Uncharacterized protein n=1 Tax=Stentor coeruleus TaxID=5963 RepID=A0A1R2C8N3_9CILI|nr:hypothetical protein SteCoe_13350 [Stentor coeruleus]
MIEDILKQESHRCKIQAASQSKVNNHLQTTLKIASAKYEKELVLTQKYEEELSRIKEEYSRFLANSQSREEILLDMIENKDRELEENLSQLDLLKQNTQEIIQEQEFLETELKSLKSLDLKECVIQCDNCKDQLIKEDIENLTKDLENFIFEWEGCGSDCWVEHEKQVQQLTETVNVLQIELNSQTLTSTNLLNEKASLEDYLSQINTSNELKSSFEQNLEIAEQELNEISENYYELENKHKTLSEKYEIYKMDKEVILNKLEKVSDMLENEKRTSNYNSDLFLQEKENHEVLQEKLKIELQFNTEVSENVIQTKMDISKTKEQLLKITDLDIVLGDTLRKIDMEGSVKKIDTGYEYNGISLQLHLQKDMYVIVKAGTGYMPLTDYLKNGFQIGVSHHNKNMMSESKVENMVFTMKETKSPMKPIVNSCIKSSKTPLRDRNHSIGDKKKVFK